MQKLETSEEIQAFLLPINREREMSNLLVRQCKPDRLDTSKKERLDTPRKESLRYRKKHMAEEKKRREQERTSFLAKTYLDCTMLDSACKRYNQVARVRPDSRTTPLIKRRVGELNLRKVGSFLNKTMDQDSESQIVSQTQHIQRPITAISRTIFHQEPIDEILEDGMELKRRLQKRKRNPYRQGPQTDRHIRTRSQLPKENSRQQKLRRQLPLPPHLRAKCVKQYSCFPEHKIVSAVLLKEGWTPSKTPNESQQNLTLKWTQHPRVNDFAAVSRRQIRFYNHIKNNPLLSEVGRCKVHKHLSEEGVRPYAFMPRKYTEKEQEEYCTDYQLTQVLILLDKHIEYCRKRETMFEQLYKMLLIRRKRSVEEESLDDFLGRRGHIDTCRQESYLVCTVMCVAMLQYLEEERRRRMDGGGSKTHHKLDQRLLKMLWKFSVIPPLYDTYALNQFSCLEMQFRCDGRVRESKWETPSKELVMRLMDYMDYFQRGYPQGWDNLWVVKTRGQQAKLTDKMLKIERNTVIEKHIAGRCVFRDSSVSASSQSVLDNTRFQLQQLVFVRSLQPLEMYTLGELRVKVEQEEGSKDPLWIGEQQFATEMFKCCNSFSVPEVKDKIYEYIGWIVRAASYFMVHIEGCFEILMFHIVLDETLNPWIVDITQGAYVDHQLWKREAQSALIECALKMRMSKQEKGSGVRHNPWIPLMREKEVSGVQNPELLVTGNRLHLHQGEERGSTNGEQNIVLIQRAIRRHLHRGS